MRRTVAVLGILAVTTLLAACGSDSTGLRNADVTGAWTLSLSNLSGSGVSCSLSGSTATLTQSGLSFSGSYTGGTLTCVGNGQTFTETVGSGTILNGAMSGNLVTFDLDTPDAPFNGTINGNSMSGTGSLSLDLGDPTGVVVLNGKWGAVRQ